MQGSGLAMATDPLDLEDLVRAGGPQPWAGMPPGTRMGHVHLHVGDLDAAAATSTTPVWGSTASC